ncbi:hypothetical protein MKY54_13455 [Paenibacillus sp. FSL P2-0121]|uniref:hypothetical protein n=1 Tax=Paenibacillus sp. FSL P2-0121 TaxID=2921626 RepID=UPI0030D46D43
MTILQCSIYEARWFGLSSPYFEESGHFAVLSDTDAAIQPNMLNFGVDLDQ